MDAISDALQWHYPSGYQWLPSEVVSTTKPLDPRDRVLSTGLPVGDYNLVDYKPPANLFLIFANTACTEEGIQQFANHYGLLGLAGEAEGAVKLALKSWPQASVSLKLAGADGQPSRALGTGELLSAWQRQLQELREAAHLWSAIREAESGDGTKLARCVQWPRKDFVYYDSHPELPIPTDAQLLGIRPAAQRGRVAPAVRDDDTLRSIAVIASTRLNSEWLKLFRVGDCQMPGKYYLQKTVNEHLKNRVSPHLLWNVRRNRPHSLGLFFVPENLLGLMWLQLAQAINGNKQYRQCLACKTGMLLSRETEGNRSSRFTCSCRMKVYTAAKPGARPSSGGAVRQSK
jgi:hypothetical protein